MDTRSEVLRCFEKILEGHLVRWVADGIALGDFEGRDETIEVFDVPQSQQRRVFHEIRGARQEARRILGRTVRVIFHTPESTTSYYGHLRRESDSVSRAMASKSL